MSSSLGSTSHRSCVQGRHLIDEFLELSIDSFPNTPPRHRCLSVLPDGSPHLGLRHEPGICFALRHLLQEVGFGGIRNFFNDYLLLLVLFFGAYSKALQKWRAWPTKYRVSCIMGPNLLVFFSMGPEGAGNGMRRVVDATRQNVRNSMLWHPK